MDERAKKLHSLENSITLLGAVQLLWEKKFLVALFVFVATIFGATYAMWVRPQFTSDALLQVNVKGTSSKATKALG